MEEKVISLISEHFGIPVAEIAQAAELRHDLNATNLEVADFFQTLEQTFHINITRDDALNLLTVSDIINFISDHAEEVT